MTPARSSPLVPVQLQQLGKRSVDGFSGPIGFLVWQGRCGVDPTLQIGDSAARKYFEHLQRFEREPLYNEDISRVESPEGTDSDTCSRKTVRISSILGEAVLRRRLGSATLRLSTPGGGGGSPPMAGDFVVSGFARSACVPTSACVSHTELIFVMCNLH